MYIVIYKRHLKLLVCNEKKKIKSVYFIQNQHSGNIIAHSTISIYDMYLFSLDK